MDGTILVADDDRTIRTVLTQAFTRAGCKVHATSSLVTLMRWVHEGKGDLVVSDVMMPDGNGLDALPQIKKIRWDLPVIVISAQNTIVTAIRATEVEAFDYLPKPFDLPDLMKKSARALDLKRRRVPGVENNPSAQNLPLIGVTQSMQDIYRVVAQVLNTEMSVLIQGESGTGKSLIANTIHDLSDRRTYPALTLNSDDMASSETIIQLFSRAQSGTIILDEVADFDAQAQSRLVRVLDNIGDQAPRILTISQADLSEKIEKGTFRSDLFYRLSGLTINIPALRDRIDDVPLLTNHFLQKFYNNNTVNHHFDETAIDMLRMYSWPGNVRQLENVIKRLCLTAFKTEITAADVSTTLGNQPAIEHLTGGTDTDKLSLSVARHLKRYFELHGGALPPPGVYQRVLREIETPLIEIALDATGGNQAKCADLLGINRNTLRKKVSELDIKVTRSRKLM